ncbi:MAG: DEAD/DEAH box helicase [Magnetococcales bacterium]|nr:DEAD/DEAH box helicase [Magnetococcales bacterium]
MNPKQLATALQSRNRNLITGHVSLPAEDGAFVDYPSDMDARLIKLLQARGMNQLYSHQGEAWSLIRNKKNCVIATPTASGKTLCYNLPVIQDALHNRSKALYLFPTKALSQDQVSELLALSRLGDLNIRAHTFDGDTPADARKAVRVKGDIIVSNPDMLHQGILPHHTKWAQFFESLTHVVIDEMHIYRGVFGAHMANVIRRLQRICRFYNSDPVFIFCSATIANPEQLAHQLIGQPVHAITQSGAPQGERHLLLWNPPVINPDLGIRASARSQTTRIARRAIEAGLSTIIFTRTRLMVEVITKYLKEVFDKDPRKPSRISAYRGGYLPSERRKIEKALRAGAVDGVVTTSALELGVDIGALDICLLNGYPGTIAGTWQRLGRAGRRNRTSLGVLIGSSQPLDQYIVQNPDFFMGQSPEHARIAPDHLLILLDHIRCAAFELPFIQGSLFGTVDPEELLHYLAEEGVVHLDRQRWHWIDDSYPANAVSLRSVADGNFVVVDITDGGQKIIAETDFASAAMTLYEQAIYMVHAQPYQVERLDWEGRKAFVRRTQADYYTDAIDYTKLKILDDFDIDQKKSSLTGHGEVHLVRRISGFKKIRFHTHENIGFGAINLPDQEMHTTAVWWRADAEALAERLSNRWHALDGFLGAAYCLHTVAAMHTMSEMSDLGRAVGDQDAGWFASVNARERGTMRDRDGNQMDPDMFDTQTRRFQPTLFLYDNIPGGIGLSEPLFEQRNILIQSAHALIEGCSCRFGCPACVGPILRSDERPDESPKKSALELLSLF